MRPQWHCGTLPFDRSDYPPRLLYYNPVFLRPLAGKQSNPRDDETERTDYREILAYAKLARVEEEVLDSAADEPEFKFKISSEETLASKSL